MNIAGTGQIGKNAACLYLRMVMTVGADLVAARILLKAFGVSGYGMLCAIAGVIGVVFFLESVLTLTTRRFLCIGQAEGDRERVQEIFAAAFGLSLAVCVLLVAIGETAGGWFIRNRLSLTESLTGSAMTVCNVYIALRGFQLLQVPFDSLIFAMGRMGFFAIMSVFEGLLLVGAAWAAGFATSRGLEVYALSLAVLKLACLVVGWRYVRRLCPWLKLSVALGVKLFRDQCAFFLWSISNAVANIMKCAGVGLLVNVYAGVRFSATWDIAWQLGAVIAGLTGNFHSACFPEVAQRFSAGDRCALRAISIWSLFVSLFLALCAVLPICLFTENILTGWLGANVPPQSVAFIRCIAVFFLFDAVSGPLNSVVVASGNVARYQVVASALAGSGFVFSWLALANDCPPWSAAASVAFANVLSFGYRWSYARRLLRPEEGNGALI